MVYQMGTLLKLRLQIQLDEKYFWFRKYKLHKARFAASIMIMSPYIVEYLIVELRSIQYTTDILTYCFVLDILSIAFNMLFGTFRSLMSFPASYFLVVSKSNEPLPTCVVSCIPESAFFSAFITS